MKKRILSLVLVFLVGLLLIGAGPASSEEQRSYYVAVLYSPSAISEGTDLPILIVNIRNGFTPDDMNNYASRHPVYVLASNGGVPTRLDTDEQGAVNVEYHVPKTPGTYYLYVSPWDLEGDINNYPKDSYVTVTVEVYPSGKTGVNTNAMFYANSGNVTWPSKMPLPGSGISWVGPVTMLLTFLGMVLIYFFCYRRKLPRGSVITA